MRHNERATSDLPRALHYHQPLEMPKRILYIKGYKLDRQKIRAVFKRKDSESEESYDSKWIKPIINSMPFFTGCSGERLQKYIFQLVLNYQISLGLCRLRPCLPWKEVQQVV
ncbi:hypothetical protein M378DRAFT_171668 [Amanita muscaria Koide BX008]|uniref:Uncharacterized protein n=1 Tax=Amanita muscaria (strain Koide BX008) TaxID=946122 RepID=A0A0C2SU37_AMAMK|nr:hypothetical protein M378DRAFT_171668 [Amanita muscaria Koide BX008]